MDTVRCTANGVPSQNAAGSILEEIGSMEAEAKSGQVIMSRACACHEITDIFLKGNPNYPHLQLQDCNLGCVGRGEERQSCDHT